MENKPPSNTGSVFSTGFLTTTAVMLANKWIEDKLIAETVSSLAPIVIAAVVWFVSRKLVKVEAFSNEDTKKIIQINQTIKFLESEAKKAKGNEELIQDISEQKSKLIQARSDIVLKGE